MAANLKFDEGIKRLNQLAKEMTSESLTRELAKKAAELYRQSFNTKTNPYGEAWEPKPRDAKPPRSSYGGYGEITNIHSGVFRIAVANPNPKRSCVPVESRGLGSWREPFEMIIKLRFLRWFV